MNKLKEMENAGMLGGVTEQEYNEELDHVHELANQYATNPDHEICGDCGLACDKNGYCPRCDY